MYGLYWCRGSGALAPEAVLSEAGVPFERILVDTETAAHRDPAFLALNPRGQVPALRLPDGSVMTESAAMVIHLCDAHPEAGLLPPPGSPARAQALRWLLFCVANLYENNLRWYYSDRYSLDSAAAPGIRAKAGADLERDWGIVEQAASEAGPWFFGAGFGALDLYLAMLARWHQEPAAFPQRFPRIARLTRAAAARPALVPVWQGHYGDKPPFAA